MATTKRVSFSELPDECLEYDNPGDNEAESFTEPRLQRPTVPPRVAHTRDGTPVSAPQSPVRKKITALQDRRVNTILLEALQLVDFSKDELQVIEKSVKKLRDAIYGFSILVDKQVTIIGTETMEERGRIRADIQDLAENLKVSYEAFETTATRMRQTLMTGKQQLQWHKKRSTAMDPSSPTRVSSGSASPKTKAIAPSSPSVTEAGIFLTPATDRVPLIAVLDCQPSADNADNTVPVYMTPDFFHSVIRSVGLDEKEFLSARDLVRCVQETLTFSIAKSAALSFMGKAFHRRLIPQYATQIVDLLVDDLQLSISTDNSPLLPTNTFFDYMCQEPFRFDLLLDRLYVADANRYTGEPSPVTPPMATVPANPFSDHFTRNGGVMHSGKVVSNLLVNRPDAEMLETAEQTLAMAKLLHDLATAESEARHGNRISIRPQATRTSEFSKAYLATSKELLAREAGV